MSVAAALEITSGDPERTRHFARMFSIRLASDYFNRPEIQQGRFAVRPTGWASEFIARYGLIARPGASGIDIGIPASREDAIVEFLRGGATSESEWQADFLQQWLSFTATAQDNSFLQFTDLPLAFDPRRECLYLTNTEAHRETPSCDGEAFDEVPDRILLTPGRFAGAGLALPKVSAEERRLFPADCTAIEVLNAVGEQVQCYPKSVPAALAQSYAPDDIDCRLVEEYDPGDPAEEDIERETCTIRFGLLRAGRYTIRYTGSATPDEIVVYPAQADDCLCFIDIFLADPGLSDGGVYPIDALFGPGEPSFDYAAYRAQFAARQVRWNYIIVPRPGERLLEPEFLDRAGNPVAFAPPEPVIAPGGRQAEALLSLDYYAFEDKPDFWLELRGAIEDRNGLLSPIKVLSSALPTPSPTQLGQDRTTPPAGDFGQAEQEEEAPIDPPEYPGTADIYVYL